MQKPDKLYPKKDSICDRLIYKILYFNFALNCNYVFSLRFVNVILSRIELIGLINSKMAFCYKSSRFMIYYYFHNKYLLDATYASA